MTPKRLTTIIAATYAIVAAATVCCEFGVRVHDRANSEFAGILSVIVTLPSSLVMLWVGRAFFAVRPGERDAAFLAILGASVLANAGLLWFVIGRILRGRDGAKPAP